MKAYKVINMEKYLVNFKENMWGRIREFNNKKVSDKYSLYI